MLDSKFRGLIISALRKLTYSWAPRNKAKARKQVAPACFQCEGCKNFIYDGTSEKNLEKLRSQFKGEVRSGKVNVDHIYPVIPIEGFKRGKWDWNKYMDNLFCSEAGLQVLCVECHDKKTAHENNLRKHFKANAKKKSKKRKK